MTSNYYHAVVIGMELGPLVAGALLAKRGFRVLVVGQGGTRDSYRCYGYNFVQRPFRLTGAHSPVVTRVVRELSLGQLFAQICSTESPCFQLITPDARVDVQGDLRRTERELLRELPADASRALETMSAVGRLNGEIEKLFGNDLVLPPETFFERREFARAEVQNPFVGGWDGDLYERLGATGRLRELLDLPVRWETAGSPLVSPLVRTRQLGAWLFDCERVQGGRDGLRRLLCDRIVGQGGDVNSAQTVSEIVVVRGKVRGVRMSGRDEPTGCQTVLTDLSPRELAPMVAPGSWPARFKVMVDEAASPVLGYSLNLGVDPKVIPAGLGATAFVSFGDGLGDRLLRIERIPQDAPDKGGIHISCIVPPGEEETIATGALRDGILDRVRWLVPFLDRHLRVLHSPYDGFGPLDLTGEADGASPPVPHREAVPRWYLRRPVPEASLGVENLPHRTGIKGLVLSGSQVVTGLSTEGELLAGWGAARIVGKMDPGRERLVRSMRSKVEI